MADKFLHVKIKGRVQGVAFRYFTKKKADELGISGWVKNCTDGSVEACITGDEHNVELMCSWFYSGSPYAKVEQVIISDSDHFFTPGDFLITY